MPKVVRMMQKSKNSLKHNAGPFNPITRKEVKSAGSLEKVYMDREKAKEPFASKVVARMADVGFSSDLPITEVKGTKKKPKPPISDVGKDAMSAIERRKKALADIMGD